MTNRRAFLQAIIAGAVGSRLTYPRTAQNAAPPITATKIADDLVMLSAMAQRRHRDRQGRPCDDDGGLPERSADLLKAVADVDGTRCRRSSTRIGTFDHVGWQRALAGWARRSSRTRT